MFTLSALLNAGKSLPLDPSTNTTLETWLQNKTIEERPILVKRPLSSPFQASLVGIFVAESELPIYFEIIKPTLHLAAEEATRRYPNIFFNIVVRNGSNTCYTNVAGVYAAEEYYIRKATAFIGPSCSLALDTVARMASYWNIPVFTGGGISDSFANKGIFSSLTRLSFSLSKLILKVKFI